VRLHDRAVPGWPRLLTGRWSGGHADAAGTPRPSRDQVESDLAARSRPSAMIICTVAAVLLLAWSGVDFALEPALADSFLWLRLLGVLVLLACLVLVTRPFGGRHAGAVATVGLTVVQAEIAWMIVQVQYVEVYLLGFTLALHGSGTLLADPPRWTAVLVGTTTASLVAAVALAPTPVPAGELRGAAFFVSAAAIVSLLAHSRRWQLTQGELAARLRLEAEQRRTGELLVQLERLSNEDPLTGLANRRRWDAGLAEACAAARDGHSTLAVVLLDVDHFKLVNDRLGHAAGDATLRALADLLRERVRGTDLAARIGGDELAVLLPGADLDRAVRLAEELRAEARQLRLAGVDPDGISVSLGVAAGAGAATDPDALLAAADAQLYLAKLTRNAVRALAVPSD
jgi:diguanylate cyclase (GGDEF)-like protein